MQLEHERLLGRVVDLVRQHEDRLVRLAQDLGHLLVARRHAGARVDDEEHEIRLPHRLARLLRDRARQRRRVGDVHSARVDEHEALARPLADELLSVTRHPRHLVHDGGARLGQPVDERRLADVGEADDRHRAEEWRRRRRFEELSLVAHAESVTGAPSSRPGGTATRGRPASCRSRSQAQSRYSSASICADASR